MPWKETWPKMEKVLFLAAWRGREDSMAGLCRRFGISRKTGYKLIKRWRLEEEGAFEEHSRRPRNCPNAVGRAQHEAIVGLRVQHPTWGPKKLKARLEKDYPQMKWPAASTIGEVLDREGLTERRASPIPSPWRLRASPAKCGARTLRAGFTRRTGRAAIR